VTTHLTRFVILTTLAHFTLEICASFLPVVYPTLITAFALTYSQVGLIALVASLCGSLTMPLFGYLSDRLGASRLVVFSIAWTGMLMGLIGLVGSYGVVLVLVGLGMLGSAAFHPAGAVLAATSTSQRRGAAMSLFSVGGNLGAALSPLWVAAGISWLGMRGTVIIMPVALFIALFLYQQLSHTQRPQQDRFKIRADATPTAKMQSSVIVGLVLITLMVMTRSWFQVAMMTYLPEWIQSQGQSIAFGGQVLAVFLIAVSVGSMTGGPLSDWLGRWQVVAMSLAVMALAQWLFLNAPLWRQIILVAVMGMMIGASFPVTIVMAQEAWPSGVGLASSLVMGIGWAPGGLGAWFTGWLADQSSLANGLQSLIVAPLVGAVGVLLYAALQRRC
jgi:FSR family fosmidomycin resistance protein-like MFS transporter